MSKIYISTVLFIIAILAVSLFVSQKVNTNIPDAGERDIKLDDNKQIGDIIRVNSKSMAELTLTSSAFEDGASIPSMHTCDGEDVSPPLLIRGVDENAKSLVLIMDDPDVPTHLREDGIWDHWIKFNIPADTIEIKEGKEPEGTSGIGTSGNLKYKGPCPPDKEHRYIFTLYSLDTMLDLDEGVTKEAVRAAMKGHILQKTELIGLYNRNKK